MSRGIKIIGLNIAGWVIVFLAMFAIESRLISNLLAVPAGFLIGASIIESIREVMKR